MCVYVVYTSTFGVSDPTIATYVNMFTPMYILCMYKMWCSSLLRMRSPSLPPSLPPSPSPLSLPSLPLFFSLQRHISHHYTQLAASGLLMAISAEGIACTLSPYMYTHCMHPITIYVQ